MLLIVWEELGARIITELSSTNINNANVNTGMPNKSSPFRTDPASLFLYLSNIST